MPFKSDRRLLAINLLVSITVPSIIVVATHQYGPSFTWALIFFLLFVLAVGLTAALISLFRV